MKKKMSIGLLLLVTVSGMAMATGLGESDWKCASCGNYVFSGPNYVEPTYYKNRTYHSKCADNARRADEDRKLRQEQREAAKREAEEKAKIEAKEAKEREERQKERETEMWLKEHPEYRIY